MKINKYWQPKTKKIYNRKNKFNKTYRGGKTLHTKETEKAFGKFLIMLIVFAYCSAGAYSLASNTRTITIKGGDAVSQETTKQVLQEAVVGVDNSLTIAPVDYSGIPYMEKEIETQIREIAKEQNFKWTNYLLRLAFCESSLNPNATNDNGSYGLDRGLFQINNRYHWEVSDECAFDIRCSTIWTMERINAGYQHEWMCDEKI